jgi:type II secretory pathway pseudopilin PulG
MRSTIAIAEIAAGQAGFCLAHVVVAVSLTGIIASFSVPRFTRLANQARATQVIALGDHLRNAAEAAHSQYLASGATISHATMAGWTVELKNGYPDASSTGISKFVLDRGGFTAGANTGLVTFFKTDAPSGEQCSVTYNAAPAPSSVATITNVKTSGC